MEHFDKAVVLATAILITTIGGRLNAQCTTQPTPCPPTNQLLGPLPPTLGLLEEVQAAFGINSCGPAFSQGLPEDVCVGRIERHLAKPLIMDKLITLRNFNVEIQNNQIVPSNPAMYNQYIDCIISILQTEATMVVLPGALWGNSHNFRFNSVYFCMLHQIISDINAAYDCLGLRRPYIQGFTSEFVEFNTSNVDEIPTICPETILRFEHAIPPAERNRYFNGATPRDNVRYDIARIRCNAPNCASLTSPDITRIEAQMFMYHMMRLQVLAGVSSFAMGQIGIWGANDRADGEFDSTKDFLDIVREFTSDPNGPNIDVLITVEPCHDCNLSVQDDQGNTQLLFDYLQCPIRPREITSPPHDDPEDGINCNSPYAAEDIAFWNSLPCSANSNLAAVFDYCTLEAFYTSNAVSGFAPNGCYYAQQPFMAYFDYADGDKYPCDYPPFPGFTGPGTPGPGTYGWSDANWLDELSEECQAAWFSHSFCRIREMTNGLGFLEIPGMVLLPHRTSSCSIPPPPSDYYFAYENAHLMSQLEADDGPLSFLSPPLITKTEICDPTYRECVYECDLEHGIEPDMPPFHRIYERRKKYYRFCVQNQDCTSSYSWHVREGNGTWLPATTGLCFNFYPPHAGTFIIGLRQDNLDLQGAAAITPQDEILVIDEYPEFCCNLVNKSTCLPSGYAIRLECLGQDANFEYFNYEVAIEGNTESPEEMYLSSSEGDIYSQSYSRKNGILYGEASFPINRVGRNFSAGLRTVRTKGEPYQFEQLIEPLPTCQGVFSRSLIGQMIDSNEMNIMPNPTQHTCHVNMKNLGNYLLYISDLDGKQLIETSFQTSTELDCSSIPSGIYFISVWNRIDGSRYYRKLVVTQN